MTAVDFQKKNPSSTSVIITQTQESESAGSNSFSSFLQNLTNDENVEIASFKTFKSEPETATKETKTLQSLLDDIVNNNSKELKNKNSLTESPKNIQFVKKNSIAESSKESISLSDSKVQESVADLVESIESDQEITKDKLQNLKTVLQESKGVATESPKNRQFVKENSASVTERSKESISLSDSKVQESVADLVESIESNQEITKDKLQNLKTVLQESKGVATDTETNKVSFDLTNALSDLRSSDNVVTDELEIKNTQRSLFEFKTLIADAKAYLKEQIQSSDAYKSQEIATLPKTLKGLAQAAQKIGIDMSKISLEEVSVSKDLSKNNVAQQNNTLQTNIKQATQISTQEMIDTKVATFNMKMPQQSKDRTESTLKLLLQGEKNDKKSNVGFTSDFSVATAKVIAPSLKGDAPHSLETLLQPDSLNVKDNQSDGVNSKVDGVNISKADSLEVKMNEAKQMTRYLSQDIKQAIDDYKSPFTRVKVQLNPQQLGEVELTVVQRGKNLHVNLSSNNSAINTLAMNANDLKVQLQNNGINNASLNFSNNSQGGEAASGGQSNPQQQNRQQAQFEYNYFENEESNEEIISSLEIVVPYYA